MNGHPWSWIDFLAIILVGSVFVFELNLIRRTLERIEKHSDFLLHDIKQVLERIEKK